MVLSFREWEIGGKLKPCLIVSQLPGLLLEPYADMGIKLLDVPLIEPFLTLFSSSLSFYRVGMFEVPQELGGHLSRAGGGGQVVAEGR